MQLFMDRHDVPGSTPEMVAEAHARDLELAEEHGVLFVTYWFDDSSGQVFCLAKADEESQVEAVHLESHGLIPHEIISVSEDNVLRFLGNMTDPSDHTEIENPFRTILFTDLEGSTALLQNVGEAEFMLLLTEHDLIIRRALVTTQGREVKHTGDGIMASFEDVARALECSLAIQDGFDARAEAGQSPTLRVRIGMAAGEPVHHNDDIFGNAVNLASRVCDAADAGGILVSETVHELGTDRGFAFDAAGDRTLKGFSDPTPVFELLRAAD
ncbi:MAG: nickel-binding protein [Acidimicrobiia bacterium]